jgi:hypothetical protein
MLTTELIGVGKHGKVKGHGFNSLPRASEARSKCREDRPGGPFLAVRHGPLANGMK